MTTPNTASLLRGFRFTPGESFEPMPEFDGQMGLEILKPGGYEHVRAEPSGPPALTRYNGDGTWKVVCGGETLASNFDSEAEASQWIAENA